MKQLRQYADDFATLFAGSKDCYGVHVPEKNPKKGEKAKGKSFTKTEQLATTLYLKHLHGETSLGVVPIDKKGEVSFAAIDVDVYPLNPVKYLTMLQKAKLPFFGCKSKSGGLHLYCFFNPPAPASTVVPLMNEVRELLGLPLDTEIFPKQTALQNAGSGNWINLPYYKAADTARYAYSTDGKELPLSVFLQGAMGLRTTPKALRASLDAAPLAEAPPCLQKLFLQGGAEDGHFRDYMFNCGVYLKARFGEAFAENLHLLNNNSLEPLDYTELDTTVIASLNKKDYNYACTSAALKEHCARDICGSRKYGVGGQFVSDFEFGQLNRYKGTEEDEYYTWEVNGVTFMLYGIKDLISQDRFRALCGSKLNKIPNKLKEPVWIKIVNNALQSVQEADDVVGEGMSDRAHWQDKVGEFFSVRKALRKEQLNDGLVYLLGNRLYFKVSILQEHLLTVPTLRTITKIQHRKFLAEYGVHRGSVRIDGKVYSFNYVRLNEQHGHGRLPDIHKNPERIKEAKIKEIKKEMKQAKEDGREYKGKIDFKEKDKF